MIKYIFSKSNKIIVETFKLKQSSNINKEKKFIIEGNHLFEMALNSNQIEYIISLKEINNIDNKIDQYIVTEQIMEKLSSNKSIPSVICVCRFPIKNTSNTVNNFVYLDCIQDPGNMGTILRNCLAFGFKNILVSEDCANKFSDKVIQSSQGAIFDVNIETTNIEKLKELKSSGYKILSTSLGERSINLKDVNTKNYDKYVIIFGNEGQGVRKDILEISDEKIFIEINNIDSLNVGVAAGIVLYKFSL